MPDTVNTQEGVQSQTAATENGQAAPPVETNGQSTQASPSAITKDEVAKMIAEATAAAVAEAREAGRRELQSQQARNKNLERRAAAAERTLTNVRNRVAQNDPDTAKDIEIDELRGRVGVAEEASQAAEQEAVRETFRANAEQSFRSQMTELLTANGIDVKDKRVDWADDLLKSGDFSGAFKRFATSTGKINKDSLEAIKKEVVAQVKKELGIEVNSVSSSQGSAASFKGIPTQRAAFSKFIENMPDAEYAKRHDEIIEAQKHLHD